MVIVDYERYKKREDDSTDDELKNKPKSKNSGSLQDVLDNQKSLQSKSNIKEKSPLEIMLSGVLQEIGRAHV